MWWVRKPDLLKREVESIETLLGEEDWLSAAVPRLLKGLRFAYDLDVVVNDEVFGLRLEYPMFFPETPPLVMPRNGKRLSEHQYGADGELCLEYRSDNWDPSITGTMMVESAYRLLSGERPKLTARESVPSAHYSSLGQQLRSRGCRFLLTQAFTSYASGLPVGSCNIVNIVELFLSRQVFTAYVSAVGPRDAPNWQEPTIPNRGQQGQPGVLLRVERLDSVPSKPDQACLERLITNSCRSELTAPIKYGIDHKFMIVADTHSARMLYCYRKDDGFIVISYNNVCFSDDFSGRLPDFYSALSQKRVGIVGCGSLGSKIAASLARSGVGKFVLIDDDIMKPGNLLRHELDSDSLGTHKVHALEARLKAITAAVEVSTRPIRLGGQESSGITASALEELAGCDILIDATADFQAFNFVASVARHALRMMVWAEVYAGGIGGFVARLRPKVEPPPHAARQQYLAWCRDHKVPWLREDQDYGSIGATEQPLVADDADVAVIAAHATRFVVDALVRPDASQFPHPGYVVGLSTGWIFSAPFDTWPIDFYPEGKWETQSSPSRTVEALEFMTWLFDHGEDADRTST